MSNKMNNKKIVWMLETLNIEKNMAFQQSAKTQNKACKMTVLTTYNKE